MLKHVVVTTLLIALTLGANAKPNAYQQALSCKEDNCPYTYEFITTPKIKKTIITTFNNSAIRTPVWLFSGNSVTTPIEPIYKKKRRYIKIFTCKPHACNSDYLEGYYELSTNSFVGVYTEDHNETRIE